MPVVQDYYTWKQFREKVLELMPVNAHRKGVGGTVDNFLTATIRQGVIRLQTAIDELRKNHECLYELTDLAQEGCAMVGVKPPESVLQNLFWVKYDPDSDACTRYPISLFPWGNRYALINGNQPEACNRGLIAIAPDGYKFYVYPTPPDGECWRLSMFYDGLKLDFRDKEQVPFDEMVAGAVAEFCESKIARTAERDIVLSEDHMREFRRMVRLIGVREKEKRDLKFVGNGGAPACTTCIDTTPDGTSDDDDDSSDVSDPDLQAAFTSDPSSGYYPLSVEFTDETVGSPTSWSWDFGDDSESEEQNPSHVFAEPGTYTVTLEVSDGTNTDSVSHVVVVHDRPVITDMDVWLDAAVRVYDAGSDVPATNGGQVWLWRALNDPNTQWVATLISPAIYRTNEVNGFPVVEFEPGDSLASQQPFDAVSTFMLLVKITEATALHFVGHLINNVKLGINDDGNTAVRDHSDVELFTGPAMPVGEWAIVTYVINGASSFIRVNGVNGSVGNIPSWASPQFILGTASASSSGFKLAEVVKSSRVMTEDEMDTVEEFWTHKYNL